MLGATGYAVNADPSLLRHGCLEMDGVLSFFETGRAHHYLLVPTAIEFVLPALDRGRIPR
jgi:hypothetical protein